MAGCRTNQRPYPIYTTVLTGQNLPAYLRYRTRIPEQFLDLMTKKPETPPGTMKPKLVQTMFRESEAQTEPYSVDVAEGFDRGLEILTLGWLSYNNGLPAGMNEIMTIERARQKRAWEAALPTPFDKTTQEMRRVLIEAMEINEWNYRENMMAAMGALRIELAEKLMKERSKENKQKCEERLSKYTQIKKEEKSKKLQKLKLQFNREIRKLVFARQKVNKKYHRWNIIKQFVDKTSPLYAPQLRFGEDPRNWHEKISPKCGYWNVFSKLQILHHSIKDIPEPLKPAFDFNKKAKPKSNTGDLCIRATKWTEEKLKKLHEELRSVRKRRYVSPKPCHLKQKVFVQEVEVQTPAVKGIPDEEEEMFQACLFLQKTIKGRAIQTVMFEGRVKCQELIEELKSTHALQNHKEDEKAQLRRKIYGLQREEEIKEAQEKRKKEILSALEGKTTGDMLDFLSKELLRLQDERKTHALALMADRERHKREAVEAGRRQVEEKRRREHDEMFKQVMKMHQNITHTFLYDAMVENGIWLAHRQARETITEIARKVDQAAMDTITSPIFTRSDDLQEEEIVADLIHNFALPEAEKRLVRERLNNKQRNYLKVCHDEVYSNIEKLVQGKRTKSGELIPLRMIEKHKVPPLVRVKYLRLKRMHESSSSTPESQNSQNSFNSLVKDDYKNHPSKMNLAQQPQQDQDKFWSTGFSIQEVILGTTESDTNKQNKELKEDDKKKLKN